MNNEYMWYESFDSLKMVFVLYYENDNGNEELIELPAVWTVCPRCKGSGSHVNPNIDGNGLTAEDFAEDPDFKEDYFSGIYDVTCYECNGRTTIPIVDEAKFSEKQKKIYEEAMISYSNYLTELRYQERYQF